MIGPIQWIVAGAVAIVLHGAMLGFAWTQPDISLEGSSGQPGAVWGMPVETIADIVDPTQAAAMAAEAVEVTEPIDTSEPTETAEPDETQEDAAQAEPDQVSDVEPAEAVDTPPRYAAAEVTPTGADRPATPAWEGGIAVAAPAPSPQEVEPVPETRVAALTPVSEAEAVSTAADVEVVSARDVTIPVPAARPADVPRVTAPPKPKQAVSKPAPAKPAPAKPAPKAPQAANPAPQATSTRTASAPAGEQAGSSGARSTAAGRQMVTSYAGRVASHLQRHKRYPGDTERGQSGTATITFTIGADGRVKGSRLSRSSGVGAFDREVAAMVSRASPFPPIPPAIGKSSMTFTVPIRFQPR